MRIKPLLPHLHLSDFGAKPRARTLRATTKKVVAQWEENPSIRDLPILDCLDDMLKSLAKKPNLLLEAPPGAGKTTVVPLALLKEASDGDILVVEPRRVAVRSAAARMASVLGEAVGKTVGYVIRGERQTGRDTRITVVTDGILWNRLREDPELAGVTVVVLDEFHERGVGSDVALALCREAQKLLRPDLKMIVMSATLLGGLEQSENGTFSKMVAALGGEEECSVVQSEGRTYPIDTVWADKLSWKSTPYLPLGRIMKDRSALTDTICHAVEQIAPKAPGKGDLLVFLPGAAEIRRVVRGLRERGQLKGMDILPLYGALPKEQQDLAIFPRPDSPRRIIVSSPIAEASLTLERVTCVVDSGLRREPRCDADTGMPRLVTTRCSRASAVQRAGRAGRVREGICLRVYNQAAFEADFIEDSTPEIVHTDLSPTLQLLIGWGCSSKREILQDLPFVDPPEEASLQRSIQLLQDLACLENRADDRLVLTPQGQEVSQAPTHPRYATTFFRSAKDPVRLAGAVAVAFLMDDEVGRNPVGGGPRNPDLSSLVQALYRIESPKQQQQQLLDYAKRIHSPAHAAVQSVFDGRIPVDDVVRNLGSAVLPGFVDLVAERKGDASYGGSTYLLSLGRSARLDDIRDASDFIVVLDTTTGDDGKARIRSFVGIGQDELEDVAVEREVVFAVPSRGYEVRARRVRSVGSLELSSAPLPAPSPERVARLLKETLRELGGMETWIRTLPPTKSDPLKNMLGRLELAQELSSNKGDWPAWIRDKSLMENLLDPWLMSVRSLKELDVQAILESSLTPDQQSSLQRDYPESIFAPDGSQIRISYDTRSSTDEPIPPPTARAKLQQFFGTSESPAVGPVGARRVPVFLHLLSPSNKVLAQTSDLPFFWKEAYPSVRSEMRGRYPKHPWPEDPLTAVATRQTKKQLQAKGGGRHDGGEEEAVVRKKKKKGKRKK